METEGPVLPEDFPPEATVRPPKRAIGAQPHDAFPVTWVDEAELELNQKSLIKGLIDQGGFVLIYGPPGSGKSFFTADIAQQIATGQPWRGRKVTPGLVVYVAAEAGRSILRRFVGWRENRMGETREHIPLAIITKGPNLLATAERERLLDQLRALVAHSMRPLALVVFDTLSRSIHGGDENKAEDMTLVIAMADAIREDFNAATAYVHHSGKDIERGARGHSVLFAAADCVLQISDHQAKCEKSRDGVAGELFPFTLTPIELGTDADGEPITTCLLSASDHSAVPAKRIGPTGQNQKLIMASASDIAGSGGFVSPGTSAIPKGARVISYQDLVERLLPKFPGVEPFRAREKIARAMVSLQEGGFLGVLGDLVWLL